MEAKQVTEKQDYLEGCEVKKSASGIRTKGTSLEKILKYLEINQGLELEMIYSDENDVMLGYYELYYKSTEDIKAVFSGARLGLPNLIIGTSKKEWKELREMLRKEGLAR